jgi:hypothetical protein
MVISSRTPEGDPNRCPFCGKDTRTEPSTVPLRDAPCPHCGSLLWFVGGPGDSLENSRKDINRLEKEIAQLAEMDLAPGEYYAEFLLRLLRTLAAPAGAIWRCTAKGNLQLRYQLNMRQVELDRDGNGQQMHDELLRQAVMQPRPVSLPPQSSMASPNGTGPEPGNPTEYLLLLVPIQVDNQVAGLLEVWQAPDRHPSAIPGYLQFMLRMGSLACGYLCKETAGP